MKLPIVATEGGTLTKTDAGQSVRPGKYRLVTPLPLVCADHGNPAYETKELVTKSTPNMRHHTLSGALFQAVKVPWKHPFAWQAQFEAEVKLKWPVCPICRDKIMRQTRAITAVFVLAFLGLVFAIVIGAAYGAPRNSGNLPPEMALALIVCGATWFLALPTLMVLGRVGAKLRVEPDGSALVILDPHPRFVCAVERDRTLAD